MRWFGTKGGRSVCFSETRRAKTERPAQSPALKLVRWWRGLLATGLWDGAETGSELAGKKPLQIDRRMASLAVARNGIWGTVDTASTGNSKGHESRGSREGVKGSTKAADTNPKRVQRLFAKKRDGKSTTKSRRNQKIFESQ